VGLQAQIEISRLKWFAEVFREVEKENNRMGRRRTLDRRALRDDFEGAEEQKAGEEEETDEEESDEEESEGEGEEEAEGEAEPEEEDAEVIKPKKKKKAVKAPAKPRSRAAKQVRMKVVWGVFNNSNQQVETFSFPDKAEADACAEKLSADKKATFFVQLVKKPLEEKEK
jgi:hypothetical protein